MKYFSIRRALLVLHAILAIAGCGCTGSREGISLSQTRTIALPGVDGPVDRNGILGRIDHMAYDPENHRLFVAAFANGSLEVIDFDKGERVRSLGGLKKPQGVAVIPKYHRVYVACADDNTLRAFDTRTLEPDGVASAGEDADNVRYDAPKDRIYVGSGDTKAGAIMSFDPKTLAKTGETSLPSHAESFQIDSASARLFVNLPGDKQANDDGRIAELDLAGNVIKAIRTLPGCARDFPMAMDVKHHRLFVVCRKPPCLLSIDMHTGGVQDRIACIDDSDDLFLDAAKGWVIVIGGGLRRMDGAEVDQPGAIQVFDAGDSRVNGRIFSRLAAAALPPHARTGLYIPERQSVIVAVPIQPDHAAELREYRLTTPPIDE